MSLTQQAAADLFRSAPDELIAVGAGKAAYRKVGRGPDVLFVHGWPVSGATFRKLLPHLVDHVTCHVIDFPSAGSSEFDADAALSIDGHVDTVRRVVDHLGVSDIAVVGHDSGGLIARHAMAGDQRLRAMGLINTEPPDPGWRFRGFIAMRRLPGVAAGFGWASGKRAVRRSKAVFGDAFVDRSLLDGDFVEFVFDPLHENKRHRDAAVKLLKSLDMSLVTELPAVHARINAPVKLVWGAQDPFFPVDRARAMLPTFPNASIDVIEGASLFSHEEAPEAVAQALLPTLQG